MIKRLSLLILLITLLVAGCDSSDAVATVTARAGGTSTADFTLTALVQITPTRTLSPTPLPTNTLAPTALPSATSEVIGPPAPTSAAATAPATAVPPTAAPAVFATTESGTRPPTSTAAASAPPTASAVATTAATVLPPTAAPAVFATTESGTAAPTATASALPTLAMTATPPPPTAVPPTAAPAVFATTASPVTVTPAASPTADQITLLLTQVAATRSAAPTAAPTAVPVIESANPNVAWFGDALMYSMLVRSFRDSNGDGTGDLQGVIDGLDYIQSLGANSLWLLPVFASPSYHGYDVTDYYKVNPDYGSNADLIKLIEAVHARGMTIFLDLPVNHTSDKHPFFVDAYGHPDSQYADFYRWRNDAHTEYETFGGVQSMPRLNYDSPKVRAYVTQIALHWMDPDGNGDFKDGVDGYRLDVASGIPRDYWAELRAAMDKLNPRAVLLGELWIDGPQIARYLQGDGLNAAFDFPTFMAFTNAHDQNGDGISSGVGDPSFLGLDMRAMNKLIAPGTYLVRFINNHDTNRIMSDVEGDMSRARAAAVWLLTAPGVPMIYYGEEIGMKGSKGSGPYYDEYRREPMDWYAAETGKEMTTWFKPADRNNAPNDGISVEEETDKSDSLLSFYQELGKLRQGDPVLRNGQYDLPNLPAVYMLKRWNADELYVVIVNFMQSVQTLPNFPSYLEAGGAQYAYDRMITITGQGVILGDDDTATIQPAGYAIYKFARAS